MDIQSLLSELGTVIGLHQLQFNEDGMCTLSFDDKMDISIEASPEGDLLYLHSSLCPVPESLEEREKLFATLLKANLLGKATNGGVFCLDPQYSDVLLFNVLESESLDLAGFLQALQSFVNAMDAWVERVRDGRLTAEADDEEPSPELGPIDPSWRV